MPSAPSVLRSTKFCGCCTNFGRLSPWMSTRSGTLPPASAVVSDWAVSVEVPTSVSLIWTSGRFSRYASTDAFWLIAAKDQNSNDLPSPPPPPLEPGVQAVVRTSAAAVSSAGKRRVTSLLQGGQGRGARQVDGRPKLSVNFPNVSAHDGKLRHIRRQERGEVVTWSS